MRLYKVDQHWWERSRSPSVPSEQHQWDTPTLWEACPRIITTCNASQAAGAPGDAPQWHSPCSKNKASAYCLLFVTWAMKTHAMRNEVGRAERMTQPRRLKRFCSRWPETSRWGLQRRKEAREGYQGERVKSRW